MLEELGISAGTGVFVLFALYFIIKWAVKNGIKEAHEEMKQTSADEEECLNEADIDS